MSENGSQSVQLIERSIIAARSEEDLRKKRAKDVVIFNLEEKGDKQDRAMTDLVIQTCMKEKLSIYRIKLSRFGKRDEVKLRPLKVTFETEAQKYAMLKGSRNLKDEASIKHL